MHAFDFVALAMLVAAAVSFALGGMAVARADDLVAVYWLVVGFLTLQGGVKIARSGVRG